MRERGTGGKVEVRCGGAQTGRRRSDQGVEMGVRLRFVGVGGAVLYDGERWGERDVRKITGTGREAAKGQRERWGEPGGAETALVARA